MPTVILPRELFSRLHMDRVDYSTAKLKERPGSSMLAGILAKCDLDDENVESWCILNNTLDAVLDEPALRELNERARVHLSRVGAAPQFVELRNRDAAAADARETRNYVSAEPRHDFLHFLSINASVFDAWLEWLDNAFKALHAVLAGAPREVYFGLRLDRHGVLHLFVRDSGAGMAPSRLEVWPSLGNAAREEPEPAHAPDAECDPREPYAPGLGQWHVGANTGLAVLTAEDGRTEVHTRASGGLDGEVAYLVFDKAVAKKRDEAARATGGRAEPGKNWYDLEAGVLEPTAVQRGAEDDPCGGRWRATGTLVTVSGCSEPVHRAFREEEAHFATAKAHFVTQEGGSIEIMDMDDDDNSASSQILKAVCTVFHSYIHKQRLGAFAPPPPPAESKPADADGSDDEASQSDASAAALAPRGKGGKAAKGKAGGAKFNKGKEATVVESGPLLKLYYCFITPERSIIRDCAEVRDDLVSRMLAAGRSAPAEVFNLRLAFRCEAYPGKVALAHLSVIYYPYVDGAEKRPEELAELTDGKLIVRRCGRTLQQQMKPMLLRFPWLGALGWASDGRNGNFSKELLALRVPLQFRTAGFVDLSVTFTPKTDKSELDSKCLWTAALKAMSESSPENMARALKAAKATVQMAICGPGSGLLSSAEDPAAWRAFDPVKARTDFTSWVRACHKDYDKEATLGMPDGAKPHVLVVPESFPANDAHLFTPEGQRRINGDLYTAWRRMQVVNQQRPKVMPESPDAPGQVRLLVPKSARWTGNLDRIKGYCPPHEDGYLFTLRTVVTPGPPGEDVGPDKALVVLDPWTADPLAAQKTGMKLRDSCVGLELITLDVELAGGLKSTARLRRACVRPLRNLLQDGGVVWLSEEDFWDKVGEIKPALPLNIALMPQHWKQATDGIRVLPAARGEPPVIEASCDTVTLSNLPFVVLRNQSSRGQAEQSAWLGDVNMPLGLTMLDADGRSVPINGDTCLVAPHVHGIHYFTVPLMGPGEYTLRVEAKPHEGRCLSFCVSVPPLTCRVRVAAPTGLVAPGGGVCRGCVHSGVCVAANGGPLGRYPCPQLQAAALKLQLHSPAPLTLPLIFTQRAGRTGTAFHPMCWPAGLLTAGDDGRYSVSFDIRDERTDGECDIRLAGKPKLALSPNGLDLRVTDLRLAGGTLPAGDAYGDMASKNRAPTAPVAARLVMTVTDRGEDFDDEDAEPGQPVTVTAEVPLQVAPGPLHVFRPELEEDIEAVAPISGTVMRTLRNSFGKSLSVGDALLRVSLRDHSGNLTSDGPAPRLSLDEGFEQVGASSGLSAAHGVATLKLRLPPGKSTYRATLSAPALANVLDLAVTGSVPVRYVRLLPAVQFAAGAAPLRGVAGGMLDADATATVVSGSGTPAEATADESFTGSLCFGDATTPASAWGKALRDCDTPLRDGGAATPLPPLPLPDKAGEHKLAVIVRNAGGAQVARREVLLRVAAGPAEQLKQPPGATKTVPAVVVAAAVRLTVIAVDRCGNAASMSDEQLAALQISTRLRDAGLGAVRHELVDPPKAGAEPGAITFVMRLWGPPQEVGVLVKLPLPPAAGADAEMEGSDAEGDDDAADAATERFASVTLRQRLQVGPPCAAQSCVSLEGTAVDADGYLLVRRGDARPLRIEMRDDAGNAATVMAAAAVALAAPAGCGMALPDRATATWKDGTGRVSGLDVAKVAALGRVTMTLKVWAIRETPPFELPLRVRVEEGRFAAQLALETADGTALGVDADSKPLLVVQAGAPLALRARARAASGAAPEPMPQPPALLLRREASDSVAPAAPALLVRHLSEPVEADAAHGALFRLTDAAAAPTEAGDYEAKFMLSCAAGSKVGACSAELRVRVTPQLDQPLRLALRPSDVATDLVGRAEHDGAGVLAGSLDVGVADCFGNLLPGADAAAAMAGARVRLSFARAVGDDAWAAVPGQPDAAMPLSDDGLARFGRVMAGTRDWPSGSYRMVAAVESGEVADSEALEFEFRRARSGTHGDVARDPARLRADAAAQQRRVAAEAAERTAEAALTRAQRDLTTARSAAAAAATALDAMGNGAAERVAAALAALAAEPKVEAKWLLASKYVQRYRQHALAQAAPHCFGFVKDLLRGEGEDISARLAAAAGSRAAYLLCRTQADVTALMADDKLGPTLVALPLEDNVDLMTAEEDAHHKSGQLPLRLGGPAASSPGFVGYLVNLVRLSDQHLAARVERRGPNGARRYLSLRATALLSVFGDAALFTTRDAMLAHNAQHGAGSGLFCLEDASSVIRGGVRFGATASSAPVRAGVAPGDEWRAEPLRLDARAVAAAEERGAEARAAEARLAQLTAARDAARVALAEARAAAPRAPVDLPGAGRARTRPEAEAGAREPKRSRTNGA